MSQSFSELAAVVSGGVLWSLAMVDGIPHPFCVCMCVCPAALED